MIVVQSDSTIEDALRVVSLYDIGSWACIKMEQNKEAFVIKTSEDETVVHKPLKFGRNTRGDMMYQMENGRVYTWDDFWQKMIDVYNLNPNKLIIVEEDDFILGSNYHLHFEYILTQSLVRAFVDILMFLGLERANMNLQLCNNQEVYAF
jgi:hypothetical protein